MKQRILRALPILLLLALVLPLLPTSLPVSAADYVKGANDASSSYKSGIYYERLLSVPLTGDGRTDVLAVALSQLGYCEGHESGAFSGTVQGSNNFTEFNFNMGDFGQGYGTNNYHWCASFVSFCLLQARCHTQNRIADWCRKHEGDAKYIWREVSCNKWASQLRTCGYFKDSAAFDGDYTPIPGDLIFFTASGTLESHIGLVLYSDAEKVYTVEGNTSDAAGLDDNGGGVYMKSYSLDSSYIRGYGILPYEVNNTATPIDYSGRALTPGLYVATTNKYVYTSETTASHSWVLPRFSTFSVTEIAGNERVKATCVIDGKTVTGYIKNNSDRIVQISSDVTSDSYRPIEKLWGYKGSEISAYLLNGAESDTPTNSVLTTGDRLGIRGWFGLSRPIKSVGYYFDNDVTTTVWYSSALTAADDELLARAGKYAKYYELSADTASLSGGTHTVTFVLQCYDGTVATIRTLTFGAKAVSDAPAAPTVARMGETSLTLNAESGCEYRMNGGEWQSSPTFNGLSDGKAYTFEQRVADSATQLASEPSEPITVTFVSTKETVPTVTTEETTEAFSDTETAEPPVSETPGTSAERDPQDTDTNGGGCKSLAASPLLLIALTGTAAVFLRSSERRREE